MKKWTSEKIGFLLAYPNVFEVGNSSLGMHLINSIANHVPGIVVDQLFLPEKGESTKILSHDRGASPSAFSIIGFNFSFEMDYPNFFKILQGAGIPVNHQERHLARENGLQTPFIIGGGLALSSNPLPLVPFLDFIFLFDSEVPIKAFLTDYARNFASIKNIDEFWTLHGPRARGVIPSFLYSRGTSMNDIFTKRNCKWTFEPLDELPVVIHQPRITNDGPSKPSALGETYLLEIGRGCQTGCRYCLLSYHQRPPRFRSLEKIQEIVDQLQESKLGFKKISLIGSNVSDHPDLTKICKYIIDQGFKFSLPSIKPSRDPEILDLIQRSGIRTMTLAPETGSTRLRNAINKCITNQEYLDMVQELLGRDITIIKLYLIFGLPVEEENDIKETLAFLEQVKELVTKKGARLNITINPFIPKLGTPFMFHVDNYLSENFSSFKKRYKIFTKDVKKITRNKVNVMNLNQARLQAFLSLGDGKTFKEMEFPPASLEMDKTFSKVKGYLTARDIPPYLKNIIVVDFEYLKKEWGKAIKIIHSIPCNPDSCDGCGSKVCEKYR